MSGICQEALKIFFRRSEHQGVKKGFFLIKTQDCRFETSRVRRAVFSIMHWIWISHLSFINLLDVHPQKHSQTEKSIRDLARSISEKTILRNYCITDKSSRIKFLRLRLKSTALAYSTISDPYKWIQDATMLMKFASTYRWYKKVDSTHLLLRKRPGQEFSGRITCNRISLNFYSNWNQSHGKKCYLLN